MPLGDAPGSEQRKPRGLARDPPPHPMQASAKAAHLLAALLIELPDHILSWEKESFLG